VVNPNSRYSSPPFIPYFTVYSNELLVVPTPYQLPVLTESRVLADMIQTKFSPVKWPIRREKKGNLPLLH